MAKYVGYKRPKDTKKTLKQLFVYLGHYKWMLILVAFLVFISAGANVTGTYLIKPVVNRFIVPGNMAAAAARNERRVILRIMIYLLYLFAYAAYRCRARKHSLVCGTRTASLYTREV